MGGFVGDVVGGVGDVLGGAVDTVGDTLSAGVDAYKQIQAPIFDNAALIGTGLGAYMGGPVGARIGGALGGAVQGSLGGSGSNIFGGGGSAATNGNNYGNLLTGLLGTAGMMQQNGVSQAAAQAAQQQALAGGQTAANMAGFKPVGTTTRFGTSNYQVDPTTGQITGFGYNPSALSTGYQNSLAGMTNQGLMQGQQMQSLANQYLGESPETVRQRYVQQQSNLLAPQNEQALAGIRNNLFQTGRQGLATGATSAGNLAATNPEMAAYYNSLANQQRQIGAGADQAAQQQLQFGQQLSAGAFSPFNAGFGAQGAVEQAAQQPLTLSSDLAKIQAAAGAQQGQLYNTGAQRASVIGMAPEMRLSNTSTLLGGLANSGIGNVFSGSGGALSGLGGLFGGGGFSMPTSTFSGWGNDYSGFGDADFLASIGL